MEKFGRGVVAVHHGGGKVFVSWRLLATDPDGVAFNVYRQTGDGAPVKLDPEPHTKATCFSDGRAEFARPVQYFVRTVIDGREGDPSAAFALPADARPRAAVARRSVQDAPGPHSQRRERRRPRRGRTTATPTGTCSTARSTSPSSTD
ncbi:MAG: hypothetical protein J0I06_01480 [Planctomycetes bacterium]|nr:hypothetical protein [Planctomycetota bacterium]